MLGFGGMDAFRKILLTFTINAAAVALVTTLLPGMSYTGGAEGIITITLVLAGVNVLIKPALSMLSLPVEIATVAVVSLFVNAAMLYILAQNLEGFTIYPFPFPGLFRGPFFVAPFILPPYGTAILGALSISIIVAVLSWLTGLSSHKAKHH
jgi:putative membrane protein